MTAGRPRTGRLRRTLLPALLALAAAAPWRAAAQLPPDAGWRSFGTEHFRVTFSPGLEEVARRAAAFAESAHERFSRELARAPEDVVDLVVTDHVDYANGFASVFPNNHVVVYAAPPASSLSLAYNRDWLELVVTHELAHVFHRDQAGPVGGLVRRLFGRVPAPWPVFPQLATPDWSVEGLATLWESRLTGAGRVHGSFHDMVLRTAALEGRLESIDRATGASASWPGGLRSYVYGSMFNHYLAETYGDSAQRRIVRATARAWIPATLGYDRIGARAVGRSFSAAWTDWQAALRESADALAAALGTAGATRPERLTDAGYYALYPRVSSVDGRVAFVRQDGREATRTALLDPATGAVERLARRNQGGFVSGPASWLPDGSGLVTAQLEYDGRYRQLHDLYRVGTDGSEARLTHGARIAEPDVAPDGRRVVAVQTGGGTNRLVLYDLATGDVRALTDLRAGVHWSLPRWSPDGSRIAASRWRTGGEYDVVILDADGAELRALTSGRALDAAPAWSPDGRYVLFGSDRTGVPNLFAFDLEAGEGEALLQVTRVATGAFHPDVSPDGRWIYFAGYHADGFHIERVPYAPDAWLPAAHLAAEPGPVAPEAGSAAADAPARDYSPWPTLRPRYWLPVYSDQRAAGARIGRFVGLTTSGSDLVGRHAYSVWAAVDPGTGWSEGALGYTYSGLGTPDLTLQATRDWDLAGYLALADDETVPAFSREDRVALLAGHVSRRWRSALSVAAGPELVRERIVVPGAPGVRLVDDRDELLGAVARAGFSNVQAHPFSVSLEDGVSVSTQGRWRWDLAPAEHQGRVYDGGYREALGVASAYRSLDLGGFARHVFALRAGGLVREGPGARASSIGGASGEGLPTMVGPLGGAGLLLPVRGFDEGVRRGTRGWSASLEYRVPVALVERGARLWPVFLDRLSAASFLDAGDAWCTAPQLADGRCRGGESDPAAAPLLGAGVEAAVDLRLFYGPAIRVRGGVGFPLRGPGESPVAYVRFGSAF